MRQTTVEKKLKQYTNALSKERDRLRAFKDEIDALEDVSSRAVEALECAIDALSEQV
jgi:hypothetical protein